MAGHVVLGEETCKPKPVPWHGCIAQTFLIAALDISVQCWCLLRWSDLILPQE